MEAKSIKVTINEMMSLFTIIFSEFSAENIERLFVFHGRLWKLEPLTSCPLLPGDEETEMKNMRLG